MLALSRRAGNSPEVIHRPYEGCADGHEELNNAKAMGRADLEEEREESPG
ncbi:hypothetical protein [Streptomyces goshikiensis]